jgi:hypothetical protein
MFELAPADGPSKKIMISVNMLVSGEQKWKNCKDKLALKPVYRLKKL